MPQDMDRVAEAAYRWVAFGETPPLYDLAGALGRSWRGVRPYSGSGNHEWMVHANGYAAGRPESRTYLVARLRAELADGLMAWEELAVTYGALHVGPVYEIWWTAWRLSDHEMGMLAGAWLERVILLYSLHARETAKGLRVYAPGMRRDIGGTHNVVAAMLSSMLDIWHDLKVRDGREWTAGWYLKLVRDSTVATECARRVSPSARQLARDKTTPLPPMIRRIALMVPLTWWSLGSDGWVSWLSDQWSMPQDPVQPIGGWYQGKEIEAWPFHGTNEDPREEGWSFRYRELQPPLFDCEWRNRGEVVKQLRVTLRKSEPFTQEVFSKPTHPMEDLPTLPDGRPKHRSEIEGPGWGGQRKPPAPPDTPKPDQEPKERERLLDLHRRMQAIRDHDEERETRVVMHLAMREIDQLGGWPDGIAAGEGPDRDD